MTRSLTPTVRLSSLCVASILLLSQNVWACRSVSYVAGEPRTQSYANLNEIFDKPLLVEMTALGTVTLELPHALSKDEWSLRTEPAMYVLPEKNVKTAQGKTVTTYTLNYAKLHPGEAARLENGNLNYSDWAQKYVETIPLTLRYQTNKKPVKEVTGDLKIYRGPSVVKPYPPQLYELNEADNRATVMSGRPFELRFKESGWEVVSAKYRYREEKTEALELKPLQVEGVAQAFSGYASGTDIEIVVRHRDATPSKRTLRLAVQPSPKC